MSCMDKCEIVAFVASAPKITTFPLGEIEEELINLAESQAKAFATALFSSTQSNCPGCDCDCEPTSKPVQVWEGKRKGYVQVPIPDPAIGLRWTRIEVEVTLTKYRIEGECVPNKVEPPNTWPPNHSHANPC